MASDMVNLPMRCEPPNPSGAPDVLLVDNDDSFTGSLAYLLRAHGARVDWRPWDTVTVEDARGRDLVVLSPGPGRPSERPINAAIARAGLAPVFGVCLGLQAITEAFGGRVVPAREIVHGHASTVHHDGTGCFADLPSPMRATRYHSLAAERASLPSDVRVTAWTPDGEIMGLRHRAEPIEAVQFHPESIGTRHGARLLRGVVRAVARGRAAPA
jgi:anthranilate synthase/aminodeoxychorismate synthase-like glutamine amidotransferase